MPTSAEFTALVGATHWKWDATDKGYYWFMHLSPVMKERGTMIAQCH